MVAKLDKTPIVLLIFRKLAPFIALLLIGLIVWAMTIQQPPEGLELAGWRALCVFGLCLTLWVTQLLPLAVTSLLGLALLPLLGVMPANEAYRLFGSPAVFFILGSFILAAGVMHTRLSEHLAISMLEYVGVGSRRLLLAILLLPAFLAFWMPEHAVAAMFLPIVMEITRALKLERGHPYATLLFLAMAWGCIIGGVGTLLGGARGPLAIGILQETTGEQITFLQWSAAAMPLVIMMLVVAVMVLLFFMPKLDIDMQAVQKRLHVRRLKMGCLPIQAKMMAVLMIVAVSAWVFIGHSLGLAAIALVAAVTMFILKLATWKDIEHRVSWGVVVMYGGAIAVGKALADTGAAAWLAHILLPAGATPLWFIVVLALATLLLTEAVSNAAAVAVLIPIAIPMGMEVGLEAIQAALAVAIMAGFAFMLPMGTPANALIYSTGHVSTAIMLRRGMILSISALLLFGINVVWLW
ncbi:MAG: DASS family sodium-coupled anion symporter [Mariprofundales bacterium]